MVGLMKQIKIIDVTPTKDANGFNKAGETVMFSGWAEIISPVSARSFFIGQDALSHQKTFRIRHNRAIGSNVNTRIIYQGKRYAISSIERENEKNFYWIIRATAKTDN